MKTYFNIFFAFVLLLGGTGLLRAATGDVLQPTNQPAPVKVIIAPDPTPYVATNLDGNSRVWQRTNYQVLANGKMITNRESFTELSSGLNYWSSNQWVESQEYIEILPNGTAQAVQGQDKVYFPGDIYQGQIDMILSSGQHLKSRPMGLAYYDGTNNVLIAELTNSMGFVVGSNVVIYPDAFTDFKADIRYTYTKAGLEQDIIIKERPPIPENYNLNMLATRLGVLTEFFNPPQPNAVQAPAGHLWDETLDFGTMRMGAGKAFFMNDAESAVPVAKQWLLIGGRQFLVEEVEVPAIAQELDQLPAPQRHASLKPGANPVRTASNTRMLTKPRPATTDNKSRLKMAKASPSTSGFVLDYQTISTSKTNYTFQSDTTYYISGTLTFAGTNTFEGGAVIKYATNATISVGAVNWLGSAYLPVVFTGKDDNTKGDNISGSTGNPTNYYANPALTITTSGQTLSNFRIMYAQQGISTPSITASFYNGQFVNCQNGLTAASATDYLRNILFSKVGTNFNNLSSSVIDAQNVTFNGSAYLATVSSTSALAFTNCIVGNTTNLITTAYTNNLSGGYNGFYNCPQFGGGALTNTFNPFRTAGFANYYLTNTCVFTNAGTTNIDATLLASLQKRTVFPPIIETGDVTTYLTLNPQAVRDTDTPDLGYHYDPLDYLWTNSFTISETLILTNGVAVGTYGTITVVADYDYGNSFTSQGTALNLCRLAPGSVVQEQPKAILNPMISVTTNWASINFRFTDLPMLAGSSATTISVSDNYTYDIGQLSGNLSLRDCQLRGGGISYSLSVAGFASGSQLSMINNLLERCTVYILKRYDTPMLLSIYQNNNLYHGGSLTLQYYIDDANNEDPYGCSTWNFNDNLFEGASLSESGDGGYPSGYTWDQHIVTGNNGYVNASVLGGSGNKTPSQADYQTGPLGRYYYPSSGTGLYTLVNAGDATADQLGLYHYTTQTNEVKEAKSIVDIGYHYVAVDANGNPIDTDGDGIPDYLEDSNGNGIFDGSDLSNWVVSPLNGLTTSKGLQVFTPLK